jgi:hypothetical protein
MPDDVRYPLATPLTEDEGQPKPNGEQPTEQVVYLSPRIPLLAIGAVVGFVGVFLVLCISIWLLINYADLTKPTQPATAGMHQDVLVQDIRWNIQQAQRDMMVVPEGKPFIRIWAEIENQGEYEIVFGIDELVLIAGDEQVKPSQLPAVRSSITNEQACEGKSLPVKQPVICQIVFEQPPGETDFAIKVSDMNPITEEGVLIDLELSAEK